MPKTIQELRDAMDAANSAAKAIIAKAESEKDESGNRRDLTEEEETQFNEQVSLRDKLAKQIEQTRRVEAFADMPGAGTPKPTLPQPGRADDAHTEFAKPKRQGGLKNFKGADAEKRAHQAGRFYLACMGHESSRQWCQKNGLELRLHQENVNTTGGYLVPEEIDNDLIDLRESYGVFRQYARRSPMSSDTKIRRRRTGGLTAYFVGEAAQGTESTKSWDQVQLTAKKLMILSTITTELNEDSAISVGDDLSGEIAYAFANKEDECGFNGDGTSTYGGITGVRSKLLGLSGTIAEISGLIVGAGNLYSELVLADFNKVVGILPQFADTPNAAWYVHKTFWGTVMQKLLYAAGGNAVTDIAGGTPPTFLGYPVRISQVMPKVEGNSQICALLGDLAKAADFGDRRQTTIMFSEHATVGGVSVFEYDEMAVRGTERFDINVHDVGNASATAALQVQGPMVGLITAAS